MQLVEKELKIGKILYICKFCGSEVRLTSHGLICSGCGTVDPPRVSIDRNDVRDTIIAILRKYDGLKLTQIYKLACYILGVRLPEDMVNEIFVELGLL